MKIYLVVNMSRIAIYQEYVEEQKKISPPLVEIDREKEYIAEEDIWEKLENLENAIDLVEDIEFESRSIQKK